MDTKVFGNPEKKTLLQLGAQKYAYLEEVFLETFAGQGWW